MAQTFAEQKDKLIHMRENYKQALLGNVEDMKEKIVSKQRLAMLAVGGIVITYVIYRGISGLFRSRKKKKIIVHTNDAAYAGEQHHYLDQPKVQKVVVHDEDDTPGFLDPIIATLKRELSAFLLAFARKKLQEFLENLQEGDFLGRK